MNQDNSPYSNVRVLHYNFSPEEVNALANFIMKVGWISHDDETLNGVIDRICKIARANELVTRHSQTA